MPKKSHYRIRNWRKYNKALIARGSVTLWISEEMIKEMAVQSFKKRHGNQMYSDALIQCCLLVRQAYHLTLRSCQGFMESLSKVMGLGIDIPDYTTISRRSGQLAMDLGYMNSEKERHILVDSTGVQVIGGSQWGRIKHRKGCKQLWRKLHIGIDADNLDICAAVVTESQRLDGNYLEPLVNQINSPIRQITGDGAYDKKSCYQVAYRRGAKPVFPPQYNAIVQRNKINKDPALDERDRVIRYLNGGRSYKYRKTRWKRQNDYHRRSLVESTMSRLKHLFGDQVRSRNFNNQVTDLRLRCAIINRFNQLGMPDSYKI